MKINKDIEIEIPYTPSFIKSNDGHTAISVSEFTEKQLREIGELWVEELVKKSKKKS